MTTRPPGNRSRRLTPSGALPLPAPLRAGWSRAVGEGAHPRQLLFQEGEVRVLELRLSPRLGLPAGQRRPEVRVAGVDQDMSRGNAQPPADPLPNHLDVRTLNKEDIAGQQR